MGGGAYAFLAPLFCGHTRRNFLRGCHSEKPNSSPSLSSRSGLFIRPWATRGGVVHPRIWLGASHPASPITLYSFRILPQGPIRGQLAADFSRFGLVWHQARALPGVGGEGGVTKGPAPLPLPEPFPFPGVEPTPPVAPTPRTAAGQGPVPAPAVRFHHLRSGFGHPLPGEGSWPPLGSWRLEVGHLSSQPASWGGVSYAPPPPMPLPPPRASPPLVCL